MTAYEQITSRAKKEGIEIGMEKGMEVGIEVTIMIVNYIKQHPDYSDEKIAKLTKTDVKIVKSIRQGLE